MMNEETNILKYNSVFIYEKVRFEFDDRTVRPLIVCQAPDLDREACSHHSQS